MFWHTSRPNVFVRLFYLISLHLLWLPTIEAAIQFKGLYSLIALLSEQVMLRFFNLGIEIPLVVYTKLSYMLRRRKLLCKPLKYNQVLHLNTDHMTPSKADQSFGGLWFSLNLCAQLMLKWIFCINMFQLFTQTTLMCTLAHRLKGTRSLFMFDHDRNRGSDRGLCLNRLSFCLSLLFSSSLESTRRLM